MAISVTQAFKDRHKAAVDTTQLKLEVNFTGVPAFPGAPVIVGGAWVDITEWAESAAGTLEEVSQLGGGASANSMNLTLINDDGRWSQRNSAGPYYGSLKPNRPMRASSVSGSESVRIFTGFSGAWPTQAKARTCQVAAQDAARILLRSDITEETVFNPSALTTGYWLTKILERAAWLAGWRWDTVNTKTDSGGNSWAFSDHDGTAITVNKSGGAAVATYTYGGTLVMQLDLVDLLIPVAPLKGKALAVLDQLAKVVDGRVYFGSQGQLTFRCPMYRNDSTLVSVETFDVDNLDDLIADQNYENSRFSQVINRAEVTSTPYTFKLDESGAAQEEEIPFKGDLFARHHFNAGESYPGASDADLWCELPSGIKIAKSPSYPTADNLVLRSALKDDPTKPGTGIKFKSGFPLFEQGRIKVAFENTGAVAEVIDRLTLKARLMRPIQRCKGVRANQASIDTYDKRDWTYNNDLIPSATACENLGAWKVEDGREPKMHVTLPAMYGVPWLEINDRITASETITKSLPVAEDFIVKRIKWAWALAGLGFITEACSLSPNFSVSALPATAVKIETSNQNMNSQLASDLPPEVIDGTKNLIGLHHLTSMAEVTGSVRKLTNAIIGSSINGMAFYQGYLWAVSSNGYVWKIDPLTMQTVNQWQMDASSLFVDCKVHGHYLYIADSIGGWSTSNRIIWFDLDNPGTSSGTNWGVKVQLGALPDQPLYNPRFLLVRGDDLYIHAREYFNPAADSDARLAVVDISSNATVWAVDANLETTSGAYDAVSNQIMLAGGYLWAISDDNPTTKLITVGSSAGATTLTVTDVADLRVGQAIKVGSTNVDYVWIEGIAGTTLTVTPAMTYAHTTTEFVFAQETVIAKIDPSTNTVISRTAVDDGHDGQGLEWDGTYLWATFADRIVRYSVTSGVPVANLAYTSTPGSAGSVQFDGSYIWWTRAGSVKQLDAKSGRLITSFTDASTTGGLILFDGRSIFKSGSGGSIYQIPRWLSRQS